MTPPQLDFKIFDADTSETVAPRLAAIGAELMVETLRQLQAGTITPRSQDDSRATLAPILNKDDGRIDFSRKAQEIYNRFRGFQPWPGAFTRFRGRGLNITAMKPTFEQVPQAQLLVKGDRLFVGCGSQSAIELLEVQPEGKKRIAARDFVHGYRPQQGEVLGGP